jgi:hypothetical protein
VRTWYARKATLQLYKHAFSMRIVNMAHQKRAKTMQAVRIQPDEE